MGELGETDAAAVAADRATAIEAARSTAVDRSRGRLRRWLAHLSRRCGDPAES